MIAAFHHTEFTAGWLAATRERTISVVVPARNEVTTIGPIVETLAGLRERGVIDEVLVADDSTDGTADAAAAAGARVVAQSTVRPELGPVRGKGDAMYRGLCAARGDVVVFVDGDTEGFGEHFVCGLLGPVIGEEAAFVKAAYRRPWREAGGAVRPTGGGRVTELCARPLLARFFPELAGVDQPLAGELAAERSLLERLPFTCGYGVDVGLLLDAWRTVGVAGLAQVDLGARQNRHQALEALGPMADAVLAAILERLHDLGRLPADGTPRTPSRAPLAAAAAAEAA